MMALRSTLLVLTLASSFLLAKPAFAQVYAHGDRPELMTSTTSVSTAVAAGAVLLTVGTIQRSIAVAAYLHDNEIATRSALALGAGPPVSDLADLFDVPPSMRREFAKLLRRHRSELVHHGFLERDALAFTRAVTTAIQLDPRLVRTP